MATAWHHHLNRLVIWTVVCMMAQQQVMAEKNFFPKVMEKSLKDLNTYLESGDLILASETLKVYIKLLTTMHRETQDRTVRANLDNLRVKIEELRKEYFSDYKKLLNRLKDLENIDVNDVLVQRKAIFELKSMYNHAANIGEGSKKPCPPACSLRRRRQARQLRKLKP
ncbi:hypothetical protein ACEWY4_017067 [Coilia grayii]|uniref:Interferon gamma n=1 Tax=Coilia grayii TaxID=363190 RepID=A0ABD1JN46_9TELE